MPFFLPMRPVAYDQLPMIYDQLPIRPVAYESRDPQLPYSHLYSTILHLDTTSTPHLAQMEANHSEMRDMLLSDSSLSGWLK
jgi:hypothetical protein